MKNKYKIDGQTLIVYNRKDNKEMLFDAEDFDLVSKHTWRLHNGYAETDIKIGAKYKSICSHRLLIDCPTDKIIDHINRIRHDNRKSNLRIISRQENNHNQSNTKGCSWHNRDKVWSANIRVNMKLIHLGTYKTQAEARAAYLEAKKIYHPTAPIKGY